MKSRHQLIIITLCLLASSNVFAADFSEFDTDGDGIISGTEGSLSSDLSVQWVELDANADGMLDPEEFANYTPPETIEDQTQNPLNPLDGIDSIDPIDPIDPTNPADQEIPTGY